MNTDLNIKKDKKGNAYILSHKRCGITEAIWLTPEEIDQLREML